MICCIRSFVMIISSVCKFPNSLSKIIGFSRPSLYIFIIFFLFIKSLLSPV